MDLQYIDHEDLQVTEEFVQERIDVLSDDDSEAWPILTTWWEANGLPQGLQLIEIHMRPSLRAWVVELLTEHGNLSPTDEEIVDAALLIDSMIS